MMQFFCKASSIAALLAGVLIWFPHTRALEFAVTCFCIVAATQAWNGKAFK